MAQADGSVIIDTRMNNDALEKGFELLKSDCESLGIACEKAGDKIKVAFADYDVSANIQNAVARLEQAQIKFQTAADYFNDARARGDNKSVVAWAERRNAAYTQVENAQRRLTQVIAAEANKQAAEEEKARVKATKAAEREAAKQAAEEEKARVKATKAAEREAEKKKKAQEKAYNEATKGAMKFGNRFRSILSGALIFNALSSGLRQLTSYFGTALKKNSEFASSFAQLKGAFLTAVQPIYDVVAPALIYLMNLLAKVMQVVGRFVSLLAGKSSSQMAENAKTLYDQANATEAAGSAAEKAKKQIMGFDEINKLNDSSSSSGGGVSSAGDIAANFEQTEIPEVDLDKMITYTSGALLALGVILTFSGANIPLGLGLIALGAAGLAAEISTNWDSMDTEVGKVINLVLGTLAAAGLVIGAILAFSGANVPLGIGLMVMGAVMLGTAVALNWESMKEKIGTVVTFLLALLSAAALVLGIILAFTGVSLPLAIALIATGATALVTQIAPRWGALTEKLKGEVGLIAGIASGALLVLGIILCAMGVSFPLGVALIVAGAAGLVGIASINANVIVEWIQKVWKKVKAFWATHIAPVFTLVFWKNLAVSAGNGLIAGFEGVINGIVSAFEKMINWIVSGLNKISISIPTWVPSIGGKTFGINIPNVSFGRVSIPRLAQGAVIPANQEFLAVLGDQKHGTNVEAPLSTIQEAVAEVMGDMLPAMVAGFEALLEENQRLRATVEGIEVGDSTIGQAANRYNQRMAIIRG